MDEVFKMLNHIIIKREAAHRMQTGTEKENSSSLEKEKYKDGPYCIERDGYLFLCTE